MELDNLGHVRNAARCKETVCTVWQTGTSISTERLRNRPASLRPSMRPSIRRCQSQSIHTGAMPTQVVERFATRDDCLHVAYDLLGLYEYGKPRLRCVEAKVAK